jgi:hypothetical protein
VRNFSGKNSYENNILFLASMVSMDLATAVKSYQFGEHAKSELIMVSQLSMALTGFSPQERGGGKKMLLMTMETVRSELLFAAHRSTGQSQFQKAVNSLNEAISLVESNQPEQAAEKIAGAISAATTSAQEAWQVLSEHGLL